MLEKNKSVKDAAEHTDVLPLDDCDLDAVSGGSRGDGWGDDYEGRAAEEGRTWLKGHKCLDCGKETVYYKSIRTENRGGMIITHYGNCFCYACNIGLPFYSAVQ